MDLILPRLLDIASVLTPLAAVGLGLVMAGAVSVHFRRREFKQRALSIPTYFALAAFVAFGRFSPAEQISVGREKHWHDDRTS
jgi:hypothetical protein